MQAEGRRDKSIMPRRRRLKPRKDCEAILGKLSLLLEDSCVLMSFDGSLWGYMSEYDSCYGGRVMNLMKLEKRHLNH